MNTFQVIKVTMDRTNEFADSEMEEYKTFGNAHAAYVFQVHHMLTQDEDHRFIIERVRFVSRYSDGKVFSFTTTHTGLQYSQSNKSDGTIKR